jgi:D-alanine--poly(phosphoribitol) ligase subunit 1
MTRYLERFAEKARTSPDAIAVDEDDRTTTYRDLLNLSHSYAQAAMRRTSGPRVMIHLAPGADAYAAMIGTGLAGGVYTPVNTMLPVEKRRRIVEIFEPDMVISDAADSADLGVPANRVLSPEDLDELPVDTSAVGTPFAGQTLAYVIFTSGSTGAPKGVAISRAALDHYVDWIGDAIRPTGDDRWSQHPNIGFDLSVLDIYGALCFGAALVPLQSKLDRLMPGQAIRRRALTIWNSVPSVVDIMVRARQLTAENMAPLRLATFCGEPLRRTHLEALFTARPDLTVFNTYGPTEATVSCTLRKIRHADIDKVSGTSVALGDEIPGMSVTLAGGQDETEGEIVLSGPQLAEGYWHDDAQTERFFGTEKISGRDARVYYTGDWAKRENEELFFVGRRDNQIKVKGHRLDLAEVDSALVSSGAISGCCVYYCNELHAFVQIDPAWPADENGLRSALANYLEPHAIPRFIHIVKSLPRNDNDKIDRNALMRGLERDAESVGHG